MTGALIIGAAEENLTIMVGAIDMIIEVEILLFIYKGIFFFTFICIFNKVLENVLLVDLPDIYLEIVMKGKIVEIEEIGEEGNIFHFHFFFLIILFIYIRRSESRDRRKRRSDSRGRKYSSISKSKSRGFFFNFIDSLYNFI